MKIEIDSTGELALLNKMIGYVKFRLTDDEGAFLSGSPLINSLLDKVTNELKTQGLGGKNTPKSLNLRDYERVYEVILAKLSNYPAWNDIDFESKRKLVSNMVYPYKTTHEEIDNIIGLVKVKS